MTTDRIKKIQAETAYPNSTSVQQALLKVWNECEQEQRQVKNCSIPDVGHTCVPEYEVSKREILQNLNMAHDNLKNRKYLNARRGIGIMIRMLEREINV